MLRGKTSIGHRRRILRIMDCESVGRAPPAGLCYGKVLRRLVIDG